MMAQRRFLAILAANLCFLLSSCDDAAMTNNVIGSVFKGAGQGLAGSQWQQYSPALDQTGQVFWDNASKLQAEDTQGVQQQAHAAGPVCTILLHPKPGQPDGCLDAQAQAQPNPNFALCDGNDPNTVIRGCTALIVSGQGNTQIEYFRRGVAYFVNKRYNKAIADLDEAIRLQPDHAASYYLRGTAYEGKKQYNKAIADLDEAIRLQSDSALAYNERGYIYFRTKQYKKAMADYDEAIRLKPDSALAYNNRGKLEKRMGDVEDSKQDLAKAKELGYHE